MLENVDDFLLCRPYSSSPTSMTHTSEPPGPTLYRLFPRSRNLRPSLINTKDSHSHFCHTLCRLCTTDVQLSSDANSTPPRYLKEVTGVRGIP